MSRANLVLLVPSSPPPLPLPSAPLNHLPPRLFAHNALNPLLRLPRQILNLINNPHGLLLQLAPLHLGRARQSCLAPAKIPELRPPVALRDLGGEVDGVAGEEKVVLGGHGEGVAHEDGGVGGEGEGHAAGDAVGVRVSVGGVWGGCGRERAGEVVDEAQGSCEEGSSAERTFQDPCSYPR